MTNRLTYTSNWWFPEGETQGTTVYEPDETQMTQLLGPNGKPYAIRRPKLKIGFDLTPKN
jgi:hypothetical protein